MKCDICHCVSNIFRITIYGTNICQYCHYYLKTFGTNSYKQGRSSFVVSPKILKKYLNELIK